MPDLRSVSFLWPLVLYSALLVPVLGIAYAYFTKRFFIHAKIQESKNETAISELYKNQV